MTRQFVHKGDIEYLPLVYLSVDITRELESSMSEQIESNIWTIPSLSNEQMFRRALEQRLLEVSGCTAVYCDDDMYEIVDKDQFFIWKMTSQEM